MKKHLDNKDLIFYQLSQIGKASLIPLFFGKKRIPFKPTFVSLEVEDGCCLRCSHCDIWKKKKNSQRMNMEEMKKVIMKLKNWLGVFQLNLTGGEPFLNKDTIPLIEFASSQGILIHTNSNGFLVDESLAKKIIKSGLNSLSISLDSLRLETYNQLRGNKEAFQKATRALKILDQLRQPESLFLSVTTIIMKQNLDELENLVYWVKEKALDAIFFQAIWQNFDAPYESFWFKSNNFWPDDYAKVEEIINRLIKLKKEDYSIGNEIEDFQRYNQYFKDPIFFGRKYPCFIGANNFDIDISGNVRLCFNFPPVGNILKEKPKDIWNSKKTQAQRLRIVECKRGCRVLLCNNPVSRKEAGKLLIEKAKRFFVRLFQDERNHKPKKFS